MTADGADDPDPQDDENTGKRMDLFRRDFLGRAAVVAVGATGLAKMIPAADQPPASESLVITVRDYGAVGDGRTDDAGAIERALAAVRGRRVTDEPGGTLFFPAGYYLSSRPITVPKNILLVGESPYATRLRYTGASTESFITIGEQGVIAEYSGVSSIWIDCDGRADVALDLWGTQEGSRVSETMAVGARKVVVDIHSAGIEGGSNKLVIEKSWLWTSGDDGIAGIRLGPESGPLSIRDTTLVGTNRTAAPAPDTAGVISQDSKVTLDNVNVEHFENYAVLTRTLADLRSPTAFHTTNGVKTSKDSTGYPLLISNALFDNVKAAVIDQGSGVTLAACRSYASDSLGSQHTFRAASWDIGATNVYQSPSAQTRMGYLSDATDDLSRFKMTALTSTGWRESAAIDSDGIFGVADSSFDGAHLRIGGYHLWVDTSGQLRMKSGSPSSEADGTVIGVG